jgi:hypothetical protein
MTFFWRRAANEKFCLSLKIVAPLLTAFSAQTNCLFEFFHQTGFRFTWFDYGSSPILAAFYNCLGSNLLSQNRLSKKFFLQIVKNSFLWRSISRMGAVCFSSSIPLKWTVLIET